MNHTKTKDQTKAFGEICKAIANKETYLLAGYAGTGKSFLCKEIAEKYPNVAFTAPTNKAAKVLSLDMDVPASTIHTYMGLAFKRGKLEQTKRPEYIHQAVVIDECSMINAELYRMITEQIESHCAVIYIGDPFQLPPVKESISKTFDTENAMELTEIVRQAAGNPIIAYSMRLRENGFMKSRIPFDDVNIIKSQPLRRQQWLDTLVDNYNEGGVYAAWTNATVDDANYSVHRAIYKQDPLDFSVGEKIVLNAPWLNEKGQILAHIGDEFIVKKILTAKSYGYDVMFIDVGRSDHEEMIVICSSSKEKYKTDLAALSNQQDWVGFYTLKESYTDISHTYAYTCHKLQGSTYDNVIIATDDILKNRNIGEMNRCMYVAVTRTRNKVTFL